MNISIERVKELRKYIVEAVQSFDDDKAVKCIELYDDWKANTEYKEFHKLRYKNKLYQVNKGQGHTSQVGWEPDVAKSIFHRIDEKHEGTLEDPIPYDGNMELFADTYYMQDNIVYKCTRDSGIAMHHALKDLIGLYVEVVNE